MAPFMTSQRATNFSKSLVFCYIQVTSEELETSFLFGKDIYVFATDQFRYVINFKEMNQENIDERGGTKRRVKRRPGDKPKGM